jgi:hypothetical protein
MIENNITPDRPLIEHLRCGDSNATIHQIPIVQEFITNDDD